MNELSFDIILPTYNPNVDFIRRSIRSVIEQAFRNWNLFVAKDGGELDLSCLKGEFNDSRVHFIDYPHRGKPATLNDAISIGSAPYIAYIDDDDIWYPSHLQEIYECVVGDGYRFVHTDAYEVILTQAGRDWKEVSRRTLNRGIISDLTLWYVSHINVAHERLLFEQSGMYDESLPFFIDWDMLQRMAKLSKPHHLSKFTCEHYVYLKDDAETNTISSAHKRTPEFSRKMHRDMFRKAFELLSPDDFADLIDDYSRKLKQVDAQSKELDMMNAKLVELMKSYDDILDSRFWRMTKPFRWLLNKLDH